MTRSNDGDAENVLLLSLALNSALSNSLADRRQRRAQLARLNVEFLQTADTLLKREEQANSSLEQRTKHLSIASVEPKSLKQQLRSEYNGDQILLEIGLGGDTDEGRIAMVEDSFSNIWKPTLDGKAPTYNSGPPGLLADLEQRVESQKARLQTWRDFQVEVSRRNEELVVLPSPMKSPMRSPTKSPFKSPAKATPTRPIPLYLRSTPGRTPRLAPSKLLASSSSGEPRTPIAKRPDG